MSERTSLNLIEPVPIDDDLCTGIAAVEDLGFGSRLVFYAEQTCYEAGGQRVNVVKRKIVLPAAAVADLLAAITGKVRPATVVQLIQ